MSWKTTVAVLCFFGFLKEFRPSESFISDMLTGPWKNFTDEQVSQDIYPISIYSYLTTMFIIFLLTDILRYKPIIILCGLSGVITSILLIVSTTIMEVQIAEFFYGLLMSTEVAYYTYIYAKVNKEYYEKVTSFTRAAYLVGKFCAGCVGQLTVSFVFLDYYELNYLTLSAQILATICSLMLPSVKHSLYFHRYVNTDISNDENTRSSFSETQYSVSHNLKPLLHIKLKQAFFYLWKDFIRAYENKVVIKWSLWWALATCGYLQIITYSQLLWRNVVEKDTHIYNGAVEAISTVIGVITVAGIGLLKINWPLYGEAFLSFFSFLKGLLLLLASTNYNIWILYLCYILFTVIYQTMVTVASFEIAKQLSDDCYALIFGINTFLALCAQSLLTFIVVSDTFFHLNITSQYFVYSCCFISLGLIFLIFSVITIKKSCKSRNLVNGHSRSISCSNIEQPNVS